MMGVMEEDTAPLAHEEQLVVEAEEVQEVEVRMATTWVVARGRG